ncbi:zona pellucida sperm-binding protein 4-like [Scomber scombrus]|uniref:Zona pellucida sperm-binding protein 4-like n=1 Tax=Scomber scombrus TaxID=13677 RepID=A0AAV1P6C2_SCOSC
MNTYRFVFWMTFIYLSLLILKCEAHVLSNQFQATFYKVMNNNTLICYDGFMSAYIPKAQFADIPLTIYVQDEHSGFYQAIAIAKQCQYFLGETDTFIILTVAFRGCFVRKQKNVTSLFVVIMALADRGRLEIVKSIPLICERKIKEENKHDYQPVSKRFFCSKDGFNITIAQNETVQHLNLDAVWIPSGERDNCKPQKTSTDSVTFSFPFTDCGTQSMVADGIITYWVYIEVKQHPQKGSIFRDTPFHLTVRCSFKLTKMTQLGIEIRGEKSEQPPRLKNKGVLRAQMRFAKDSTYRSFYSSRDSQTVTELGQSVYVEVFVLKHQDEDLVLLLEDCWATPTKNPHDSKRWNLLVKGCPFTGDSHRTVVLPVVSSRGLEYPSLHKRFKVKLFSFVKPQTVETPVYFHCDIEICKGADCSQSCSTARRKSRRITSRPGQRISYSVVSGGPFLYYL